MKFKILLLFFFFSVCKISEVHYIKFAEMNVSDEGFLNHNFLQAIGISEIRDDAENLIEIQNKCLSRAEFLAKKKLLYYILSINPPKSKTKYNHSIDFTLEELIFYSMNYEELLSKSFIAFQEVYKNNCKVVLRINEKNLLNKIKKITLN